MIGTRVTILINEAGIWREASSDEIDKFEDKLHAGKKSGGTAVVKVHAESIEEEATIFAALAGAFVE